MGYYGGTGGRWVHRVGPFTGIVQPTPADEAKQRVQCRWKVGFELEIPRDWLSGVYLGKLQAADSGYESHFLVVLARGQTRRSQRETDNEYAAVIYTAPKGNFVFNAATCWWNMPLARPPGAVNPPRTDFSREDARVQRITKNLLERMKQG